ncbi:MAG TPA: FecR family protein [Candidatus Acidoferrales bacterium]|nr:FecR family protein [Candidatus Acidoferrales bacterium]
MIRNRAVFYICVAFVVAALVVPPDVAYAAASAAQHAGSISLILPKVELVRGTQTTAVQPPTPVYWGDVVNTAHMARARVKLDDGSVLNVGSDSSLTIVKHDASQQQTEIDVTYGEVRSKVVHLVKPAAKFQIRTPTGVAGVVGTDFYMAYNNSITRLVVFQGTVKFCNLAGQCVMVGAGQMSSIRDQNATPDPPIIAPNQDVLDAGNDTKINGTHHGIAKFVTTHPIWFTVIVAGVVGGTVGIVKGLNGGSSTNPKGTSAPVAGRSRIPPAN